MFGEQKEHRELKKYGRVIEEEDKIIVYVKQGIMYKHNHKDLLCDKKNNKSTYYIFDNIIFQDGTFIIGTDANLIFRNCLFTHTIKISRANHIAMENNKYHFYAFEDNCVELTANEVSIRNNDFTNLSMAKKHDEPMLNMTLIGDKVNIENSVVCTEYNGNINIMTQDLSIKESSINGPNVYINADNIRTKKSVIVASQQIEVDNENCNFTCAIKSPVTIYNGIKQNSSNSKIIDIDEEKAKLLRYRMELINTLQKVEVDCIKQNSKILADIQKRLKNRKICKVLKK